MNSDLRALLQLFENKVATLWQIDGQIMETLDDEKAYRLENRQRTVQREVDDLRDKLMSMLSSLGK